MLGDFERRNKAFSQIRESLKRDPTNLDLANRYWHALAGPGGDVRSGQHVIDAYGEAALGSSDGAVAFARAYRELFDVSGEFPRSSYCDESLIRALRNCVSRCSEIDRHVIEWLLEAMRE